MRPDENVAARLQANRGQVALASISWHELLYGYYRLRESRRKERVGFFIYHIVQPNVSILPYDETAAQWFAQERARLAQIGRTPVYSDGQIAAIAATNNLILVTRHTADFTNFDELAVENWFEAP